MRMIRLMCGVSLKERWPSTGLRRRLGVEATGDVMRRDRLRWHGHVEGKDDAGHVEGKDDAGHVRMPGKTWQNIPTCVC